MPYTDETAPESVKELSQKLRDLWVRTFNALHAEGEPEERCFAIAWNNVNRERNKGETDMHKKSPEQRVVESVRRSVAEWRNPDHYGSNLGKWDENAAYDVLEPFDLFYNTNDTRPTGVSYGGTRIYANVYDEHEAKVGDVLSWKDNTASLKTSSGQTLEVTMAEPETGPGSRRQYDKFPLDKLRRRT